MNEIQSENVKVGLSPKAHINSLKWLGTFTFGDKSLTVEVFNSLKFSFNKRQVNNSQSTRYNASEPHRSRVRQVLLLWPWGRFCASGPSAEGASELAAYIVHPMKSQMSDADLLSSKRKSVLPCPCRTSEEKSLPPHLPVSLPPPRDNQILHSQSTKSSRIISTAASRCT